MFCFPIFQFRGCWDFTIASLQILLHKLFRCGLYKYTTLGHGHHSAWRCFNTWQIQPETILNTLRPRQDGRHFPDDTFKRIFLNENVRISIKISLKFVHQGPINNNPALVQIRAWRRSGDKPLSEPMMVSLPTHICVTRSQWVNCERFWILRQQYQQYKIIGRLGTDQVTSHYLNQCGNIVNWTLRNKLQWNFDRNSYIFIQENAFDNVVWKMAAILSWTQCVKGSICEVMHGIQYVDLFPGMHILPP